MDTLVEIGVTFDLLRNAVHDRHRFNRPGARRRFGRQHDRIGTIINRGRNVGHLGAGGRRRYDHRFEHLRRNNDGLAHPPRGRHNLLLQWRHLFGQHLNTQITARDHHAVGEFQNFFQPSDRRWLFNLRQQRSLITDQLLALGNILWPLDKGHRDPIHALLQRKGKVGTVLFGERGNGNDDVRDVQPLAVRQCAANFHRGIDIFRSDFSDPQNKLTIVEQQPCADFQCSKYLGVRQMHAMRVARRLVGIQPEIVARVQFNLALGKGADAQLGPLQIHQDRRGPVIRFFERADIGNQLRLVGLLAMAHVDAKGIGAGAEQLFDHLGRVAGGAQCRQYADLAHTWLVILHRNGSAIWILTFAPPITGQVTNGKGA